HVAVVDLGARYEAVDVDRVRALDLDLLELVVLDHQVLALADLVAAPDVLALDHVAALAVDQLLLQPVAGLLVDAMEAHLLGARRRRIERNRARDDAEPQTPRPLHSRRHEVLPMRKFTAPPRATRGAD